MGFRAIRVSYNQTNQTKGNVCSIRVDSVLNCCIVSVSGGRFSHQSSSKRGLWWSVWEGGREGSVGQPETERGREKERRPHGQRRKRTEAEEATGDDGIAADTHSLKSRKERGGFDKGGDEEEMQFWRRALKASTFFCSSLQLFSQSARRGGE